MKKKNYELIFKDGRIVASNYPLGSFPIGDYIEDRGDFIKLNPFLFRRIDHMDGSYSVIIGSGKPHIAFLQAGYEANPILISRKLGLKNRRLSEVDDELSRHGAHVMDYGDVSALFILDAFCRISISRPTYCELFENLGLDQDKFVYEFIDGVSVCEEKICLATVQCGRMQFKEMKVPQYLEEQFRCNLTIERDGTVWVIPVPCDISNPKGDYECNLSYMACGLLTIRQGMSIDFNGNFDSWSKDTMRPCRFRAVYTDGDDD